MQKETNDHSKLCLDCQGLIKAGRFVQPHQHLRQTDYKEFKSPQGRTDEYYYECEVCGKTWLRETGAYGHGWVE